MDTKRLFYPALTAAALIGSACSAAAPSAGFHDAPPDARQMKNPSAAAADVAAGASLYLQTCAGCHGRTGGGSGNVPALTSGPVQNATDGELFWFVGKGSPANGMPACVLPDADKWRIISYVRSIGRGGGSRADTANADAMAANAPPPAAPFTDYRYEQPGARHHITVADLPEPMPATSVGNAPEVVHQPEGAWPKVPSGFKVERYARGLHTPRILHTAPNGDIFVVESGGGSIRVYRGLKPDGTPAQTSEFATGLNHPYGLAFYPAKNPSWIYVGNNDSVVRIPYTEGALQAAGAPEKLADLPGGRGHWTRDLAFSPDGKQLFVGVGSGSNVDDPDTHPTEKDRADILAMSPEGKDVRVFAYGIRNPSGVAVQTSTGELWCSVNERDGLGDNLVPDYITHVRENGFYGWPWWYMGTHQDPRHNGKHPELRDKAIVPDVLLQPHHASLGMAFYEGRQFPDSYRGDLFACQHGSWNRSVRTGYELIRVLIDKKTGRATGAYEDFMTGFVVDPGHVWGRPVGVTVASDGALLVSDDGSNSIWRVSRAR